MGIQIWHRMSVKNRNGRVVYDSGEKPSHSYLLQFLRFINGIYQYPTVNGPFTAKDVAGASSYITRNGGYTYNTMIRVDAGVGIATYGIVVGINTGVTAEDNANYVLDTLIAHGTGGGQLNYQAVTMVAPRVVVANVDFDICRPFINESGNTITVKEIALYCISTLDAGAKYFCLLRDVTADTAVADDETLTVVYTLRTTA